MGTTMTLLPETDDNTVCISATGVMQPQDFKRYFEEPFLDRVARNGFCNVYLKFEDDFQGWSLEAADVSFRFITSNATSVRRLAYVNAPDSRRLLMAMMRPVTDTELKYFESGQEREALEWLKRQ